jgi:alpha-2-macroglobulin
MVEVDDMGWFRGKQRGLTLAVLAVAALVGAGFIASTIAGGTGIPSVESYGPASAKDVPVDRPVSITFDRPMIQPLAERAFRVDPAVGGSFSWKGNTLLFTPRDGWARSTHYTVSLDTSARGLFLAPVQQAVSFDFMTAKDLSVTTVQPSDGASEVAASNAIVVQFSYPIVPLGAAGQGPNPLTIQPALPGKGKWVTTSLYVFQPDGGLAAGVKYDLTIAQGLPDTGGSTLASDFNWSFTTKAPTVSTVSPEANTRFASPTQEVKVSFDQAVDHSSAEQRFSLKGPRGEAVAGAITWDGDALVFKPGASLSLSSAYTAIMAPGVKAVRGDGVTGEFSWSFTTVGAPSVHSTAPAPGVQLPPNDSVQIQFSNPMDQASAEKAITMSPKPPQGWRVGWQDSDTKAVIWGGLKPSTSYTMTVSVDAMDRYGQKLSAPFSLTFTTAPLPPTLNPLIPGFVGTFNAAGTPTLFVDHTNITQIDLVLYRLDQATFTRMSWDGAARKNFKPDEKSVVKRWSEKPAAAEKNVAALTSVALSPAPDKKLQAGFYYLRVQAPGVQPTDRLLVVSRLGLTMKRSQDQLLVWATDLTSGDVVSDLPLRITDREGKSLATGRTDKDGLWLANGIQLGANPGEYEPVYAFSEGEGDVGAVGSEWADGIRPYEYGIPYDLMTQPFRGYIYTDRPIYRPGQKVDYKGIVRSDDDANYAVPSSNTDATLEVMDGQGRKIYSGKAKLSDMGTFDGDLPLSADVALGNYNIALRIGNWGVSAGFSVAEYRKPDFEVKVATEQKSYVHGDQIPVAGSTSYYFGQPLANSRVKWVVTSANYFFSALDGYQFIDSDILRDQRGEGERKRTEGQTTTDAQGNFSFQVPADLTQDPMSQTFTIEATVVDANNQEVSARTDVIVHKGQLYAGLKPAQYVTRAGDPASVDLVAVDKDGKPAPGVQVTVSFFSRKWLSVKERQPDGGYMWNSKPEDTLLSANTLTTDASGKTRAAVTPQDAGSIRVVAEVADGKGNKNRSAAYIYVSGSGFASWQIGNTDRVDLVPDKKEYAVGDTAKVLIPSPVPDALALVTIERGKLLSQKLMRLKGNSETIDVPIEGGYVPNVYVSVVLFKGAGSGGADATFKLGYGELKVAAAGKALRVAVTPDKSQYQPGDSATYSIKTTDSSGKGVPSELSLAVVDAAVLSLSNDATADPMDTFWGRRGLGTSTSATLTQSVDRYNTDLSTQRKGAGGGSEVPTVRREFPDTAYWNPAVRTNDNGEATVTMTVPDSLTTWKTTAMGVTAATQVGTATAETVTTKSLLLRPAFPRFLLMGDHLKLSCFLHNYTDSEVEADVSLAATGVQPESGNGFATQRVRVAPGDMQKVEWPVKVDTVAGGGAAATLRLEARPAGGGVPGDSVDLTLPVNTLTTAESVVTSGEVSDSTTELVQLPDGINTALGELTVETSPSLAAGMRYSARFLDEFPYECTEQTVSRFLPRVVMQRAFDKLKLPDRDGIAAKLPGIVSRSIQQLYAAQRSDGGWGWWPGDDSDQWITAYVVQGLAEAARSGYTLDRRVMDQAAQFLRLSLDQPSDAAHPENPNGRAYVLYALAVAGKGDVGLTNSLYDRRSTLGNYGRAYLALALQTQGAGVQSDRVKNLVSDLSSVAITSGSGAHWEEKDVDYRTMNTNTRSTAVVLDALLRAAPDNQSIQPAVRWLMVARKEGHWQTTQETAMSLLALTDYLETSGELNGDFTYRVDVNGRELATETVKSDNVDETKTLVVQVKDLLQGPDNRVDFARANPGQGQSGDGKLYYTMQLRYYLPGEQVDAVSQGLALSREYFRLGDEAAGPITQVKPGETVKVKLTVVALQDLHYLVVEDPLPSGLEAVDTRLKTTSLTAAAETGGVRKEDASLGRTDLLAPWWRYDYFQHVEPRDDKVALFANFLPRGTYEYTYLAQATSSGDFQAMPASGYEMYFPDVWGRSYPGKLSVGE